MTLHFYPILVAPLPRTLLRRDEDVPGAPADVAQDLGVQRELKSFFRTVSGEAAA